jgi:hypothetical protein
VLVYSIVYPNKEKKKKREKRNFTFLGKNKTSVCWVMSWLRITKRERMENGHVTGRK